MKFILSTLTLASFAAVGMCQPDDESFFPNANQTSKAVYCNKQLKSFVKCAVTKDYAGNGVWKDEADMVCLEEYLPSLESCRGTAFDYDNFQAGTPDEPAVLAVGGFSSGSFKGYFALPDDSQKVYSLSCNTCSKYVKELLSCALPFQSGETPDEAFERCVNTDLDLFYFEFCMNSSGHVLLDPRTDPTYALVTPVLNIDAAGSHCKSLEATQKSNGNFLIKTLKDSMVYEEM